MDKYKKAFFVVAIAFSLPLCFTLIVELFRLRFIQPAAGLIILWWGMYFYLKTASKLAFWLSFLLVNSFWWPLLFKSVGRILFLIENGTDAYGFPTGFLIQQIFFVPLTFALIFGVLAIKGFNKAG